MAPPPPNGPTQIPGGLPGRGKLLPPRKIPQKIKKPLSKESELKVRAAKLRDRKVIASIKTPTTAPAPATKLAPTPASVPLAPPRAASEPPAAKPRAASREPSAQPPTAKARAKSRSVSNTPAAAKARAKSRSASATPGAASSTAPTLEVIVAPAPGKGRKPQAEPKAAPKTPRAKSRAASSASLPDYVDYEEPARSRSAAPRGRSATPAKTAEKPAEKPTSVEPAEAKTKKPRVASASTPAAAPAPFPPIYKANAEIVVARIMDAVKVVGFDGKNATRAAAILKALEGADRKEKSSLHTELKGIYRGNWDALKAHNQSLLPVSVKPQPKARRNKGPYVRAAGVS